jgi:hypothetical protein
MAIFDSVKLRWFGFVCAVGLAAGTSPVTAATGSFSIPPTVPGRIGGAVAGLSTLHLPASGTSGFVTVFVLPRDYLKNGTVQIVFYLEVSNGAPCSAKIVATVLTRTRVGRLVLLTGGLSPAGGSQTADFPANGELIAKVFNLNPVFVDTFPGQRRGDGINAAFVRQASDPVDTCSQTVSLHQIDIRYPLAP